MEFVKHLQYEYAQVGVDSFYENVTLVHYSVAVCNFAIMFCNTSYILKSVL